MHIHCHHLKSSDGEHPQRFGAEKPERVGLGESGFGRSGQARQGDDDGYGRSSGKLEDLEEKTGYKIQKVEKNSNLLKKKTNF